MSKYLFHFLYRICTAYILCSISKDLSTSSVLQTIYVLTIVSFFIGPLKCTKSMVQPYFKLSVIFSTSIRPGLYSRPCCRPLTNSPSYFSPSGQSKPFSISFTISVSPNVLYSIRNDVSSLSISFSELVFSVYFSPFANVNSPSPCLFPFRYHPHSLLR